MALRFCDSFDHVVAGDVVSKYEDTNSTFAIITGRTTSAIRGSASHWRYGIGKTLDAQATWIVGFAFFFEVLPAANQFIVKVYDGATLHVTLQLTPTGMLEVTRSTATVLATGTVPLVVNVWHYIEFKVTISDTGNFTVRVNGTAESALNNISADTRNAANASANIIWLMDNGSTNSTAAGVPRIDDYYICDGSGSAPSNDFLGDVRVTAHLPNGNGNSSQFDGSDGNQVDNYLLVDDATQDGDTTYVQSPDVGDKDTYAYSDASGSGTVYGVQTAMYARKTDAGTRSIVSVARSGASETDGSAKALSTSYRYYMDIRETKPGGGAYSISDFNAAEFGVKVSA